jgi:galactofuranosylgalactofuranosylrhamnosyl-N-acetylglucosaminyl-diphospho-decaprenol beta-1,5/1,6-galactofuranosyltransferase
MRRTIATAMPAARALAAEFPETVVHRDPTRVLHSRRGRQVYKPVSKNDLDNPTGMPLRWFTLKTLLSHWMHRPHSANVAQPEVEFGKEDALWWRVPGFDSLLVSTADGSGKNIYTRDRRQYRRMLRETVRLHAELRRRWPELQKQYRDALPALVSPQSWQQIFEEQA